MLLPNSMNELDSDSLTKLNTQLNRSMVLMDTTTDNEIRSPKSSKTIKINTKVQPSRLSNGSPGQRKSILKKSDIRNDERGDEIQEAEDVENNREILNNTNNDRVSMSMPITSRPRNIDDLVREENLIVESKNSTFNLDNLSDSEDMWVMDIPTTIDPRDLKGQTLVFGEKSKFKIKEEKYYAVNHDVKCNMTWVFNTGKVKSRYKPVHVKPMGAISVRRKLSGISKTKPMQIENSSVPFPENLKVRHPLFGVSYEGKVDKGTLK
ncbi:uncharacterized protein LOC116431635 isoform X2 [Nomia melanderi]|uniref:uncharacterized protein LOC116431635 isoform X2 n=1 Tax=Nomia melanderi TaxID=2448451 RepID=UPI0013046828|nr:uncharacterized protein LOC116431635 isoform X2 [Nomia melanderi]